MHEGYNQHRYSPSAEQWHIYSGAQWGMCLTNFHSLLNVILNKHVTYLSCSCYTHMNNNLEVVAMLCSHKFIFRAVLYCL